MPISIQITLIISIVVITCVAFLCSVVRNQQRIEEMQEATRNNETVLEIMDFVKNHPEFQKLVGIETRGE